MLSTGYHPESNQVPQGIAREPMSRLDSMTPNTTGGQANPSPARAEEIKIVPLNRGYIVTVGCQTVAIGTTSELLAKLSAYLLDPVGVRKAYEDGAFLLK